MDKTARILFICLSVALAAGVGYFWNARNAEPKSHLVILHANDTHSHFEPVRDEEYIERAAYLDSVRVAEGPENVLLLHAGDFSQGTTYFSELGGNLEVQALNAMKYDVVTLGNHEFDNGLEDLGRRLSSLEMPVVVCNYDFSPFEAGKYIKPYVILEKAGLKIGVIGVLCDLKSMVAGDIAERVPEFPMVETVQKYAPATSRTRSCAPRPGTSTSSWAAIRTLSWKKWCICPMWTAFRRPSCRTAATGSSGGGLITVCKQSGSYPY